MLRPGLRSRWTPLVLLVALAVAPWLKPHEAGAWGSVESWHARGAQGTHKFVLREAYKILERDPAWRDECFPSLETVLSNEGISLGLTGAGPDGDGNSLYSEHFYNPRIAKGGAPASIGNWHKRVVRANLAGKLEGGGKGAAYSAHYLADMCVPYHVNGAPYKMLLQLAKEQHTLVDKFLTLPPSWFGSLEHHHDPLNAADRYIAVNTPGAAPGSRDFGIEGMHYLAEKAGKEVDWFDPWLLNGVDTWPFDGFFDKTSSHVIWELKAYLHHYPYYANAITRSGALANIAYDAKWKNVASPGFDEPWIASAGCASALARACAQRTASGASSYLKDIPSAIVQSAQSVATLWRSSISALRPALMTTKGADAQYEISGDVTNAASEAAQDVRVRMRVLAADGTVVLERSADLGTVPAEGYRSIPDVWRTPALGPKARVRLEVIGRFENTPDLQYAVDEMPLEERSLDVDWSDLLMRMKGAAKTGGGPNAVVDDPIVKDEDAAFHLDAVTGEVSGSWKIEFWVVGKGRTAKGLSATARIEFTYSGTLAGKRTRGAGTEAGLLAGDLTGTADLTFRALVRGPNDVRVPPPQTTEVVGTWKATVGEDGKITGSLVFSGDDSCTLPFVTTIRKATRPRAKRENQ